MKARTISAGTKLPLNSRHDGGGFRVCVVGEAGVALVGYDGRRAGHQPEREKIGSGSVALLPLASVPKLQVRMLVSESVQLPWLGKKFALIIVVIIVPYGPRDAGVSETQRRQRESDKPRGD